MTEINYNAAHSPASGAVEQPIQTWQDRIKAAHPKSVSEHWPSDLKAGYMAHEIADLRATLATQPPAIPAAPAVQASGELLAWIEKVGSVRIERVRAGFKGPIRWDIEYGPHEDEARGDTLQDAIRAALASPPASGEKP